MLIFEDAEYLQFTLSSKLFEYAYKRVFSSVSLGEHGYQYNKHGYQYNKHALVKLPVIKPTDSITKRIKTSDIESFIFEIYKISPDEIKEIEASIHD